MKWTRPVAGPTPRVPYRCPTFQSRTSPGTRRARALPRADGPLPEDFLYRRLEPPNRASLAASPLWRTAWGAGFGGARGCQALLGAREFATSGKSGSSMAAGKRRTKTEPDGYQVSNSRADIRRPRSARHRIEAHDVALRWEPHEEAHHERERELGCDPIEFVTRDGDSSIVCRLTIDLDPHIRVDDQLVVPAARPRV